MIEDVEDLRAELDVESLRNAMDREVLGRRKIQIYKLGSNDGIAARIAQQIGASAGNAGLAGNAVLSRGRTKSLTLRGYSWSRLRQCVAIYIYVGRACTTYVIVIHGIAARNAVWNAELVCTAISQTGWVSIDDYRRRNSSIDFEDAAYLPSAHCRLCKPVE